MFTPCRNSSSKRSSRQERSAACAAFLLCLFSRALTSIVGIPISHSYSTVCCRPAAWLAYILAHACRVRTRLHPSRGFCTRRAAKVDLTKALLVCRGERPRRDHLRLRRRVHLAGNEPCLRIPRPTSASAILTLRRWPLPASALPPGGATMRCRRPTSSRVPAILCAPRRCWRNDVSGRRHACSWSRMSCSATPARAARSGWLRGSPAATTPLWTLPPGRSAHLRVAGVPPTTPHEHAHPAMQAAARARRKGMGGGWKFVVLVSAVFVAYCALGVAYKVRRLGTPAGLESLPHVEMWRDLPALVRDGIVFSVDTLKSARRRDHYQTVL